MYIAYSGYEAFVIQKTGLLVFLCLILCEEFILLLFFELNSSVCTYQTVIHILSLRLWCS